MVKVTRLPLPCVLKNALAFISLVPRLILCTKGLGHLLLLSYLFYFACLLPFCCCRGVGNRVGSPQRKQPFKTRLVPIGLLLGRAGQTYGRFPPSNRPYRMPAVGPGAIGQPSITKKIIRLDHSWAEIGTDMADCHRAINPARSQQSAQ